MSPRSLDQPVQSRWPVEPTAPWCSGSLRTGKGQEPSPRTATCGGAQGVQRHRGTHKSLASYLAPDDSFLTGTPNWSAGLGVGGRRIVRGEQVVAVGCVEQSCRAAGSVRRPVLPDDGPLGGIKGDDAVAVVVVDRDEAVGEPFGETWVVEHARPRRGPVAPQDAALAVELVEAAGSGVVGDEVRVGAELLRVGRVGDGQVHGPDETSGDRVLADPRAVNLRDAEVAVSEWGVAV